MSTSIQVRSCRRCGCTEEDCRQCIIATGLPCSWVEGESDLCTRCADEEDAALAAEMNACGPTAEDLAVGRLLQRVAVFVSDVRRLRELQTCGHRDSTTRISLKQYADSVDRDAKALMLDRTLFPMGGKRGGQ